MNDVLARVLDNNTPKFNKNVTEGAAKKILKTAPEYLDEIITTSVNNMQHTGLEYHGWRKLTPKEEFDKLFTSPDKKTLYDIAVSDLYMIELRFVYRGTPIPRFVYLPYADRGNLIKISDTIYNIVPILSDTVISPSNKEIFVRLLKDKLTFSRYQRNFIIDGEKRDGQVIYSNTYRLAGRKIQDNLGLAYPAVSLYLLGMYGFKKSLEKYANVKNVKVTLDNADQYREMYHVYESTKLKPRNSKETYYVGHDLKILIPKDEVNESNKSFLDNFIFGIIYTFDVMPDIVNDFIMLLDNHDVKDEVIYWRIVLGKVIFRNGYSIDKIMSEMTNHFGTLQNYMDNLIIRKLKEIGVDVNTVFDLMAVILSRFNTWLINSKEYNSDISNRYVDILYYILYDIIYGINKSLFDINKKFNKKVLSEKEIVSVFSTNLTAKRIYSIVKSSAMNLTINMADTPTDIMYPKITSVFKDRMVRM